MPTLKRPYRGQRNRRGTPLSRRGMPDPLVPTSVEFDTPKVTVTFPASVVLKGIPPWPTNDDISPTAVARPEPNILELTYPTPGAAESITIPEQDRTVRAFNGAYVRGGVYSFPEV